MLFKPALRFSLRTDHAGMSKFSRMIIDRSEFPPDSPHGSHWVVFDPVPGALDTAKDQLSYETTVRCDEAPAQDVRRSAAASRPTFGLILTRAIVGRGFPARSVTRWSAGVAS